MRLALTWTATAAAVAASLVGDVAHAAPTPGEIVFTAELTAAATLFDGHSGDFAVAADGSGATPLQPGEWNRYAGRSAAWVASVHDRALWVTRPDRSQAHVVRALGAREDIDGYVWSPDGTRLAVTLVSTAGCVSDAYTKCAEWYVEVIDANGGGDIGAGGEAQVVSWSPDGRYLVLESGLFALEDEDEWYLEVVAADGSGDHALYSVKNTYCWSEGGWSPDGMRLVLVNGCAGRNHGIHVVRTSDWHRIAMYDGRWPDWSSDGSMLAFTAPHHRLTIRRGRATTSIAIAPGTGDAWAWAPHRPQIAYISARNELSLVDARTGRSRSRVAVDGRIERIGWSPNGRSFAIVIGRSTRYRLLVADVAKPAVHTVSSGRGTVDALVWSASSGRIALGLRLGGAARIEVATPVSRPSRIVLRDLPGAFDTPIEWSRDERSILVQRQVEPGYGVSHLFTVSADGTGLRALLPHLPASDPTWSPDGSTIAFWSDRPKTGRRPETVAIYTVHRDGTGLHLVVGDAVHFARDPSWSPDGHRLAFTRWRNNPAEADIYLVDIDGPHLRRLTHSGCCAFAPAWSPDGRSIAFQTDQQGVMTASVDGTKTRPLATGGYHSCGSPAWAPSGEQLALACGEGIVVVAVDGTSARLVAVGAPEHELRAPAWSADGSRIVYSASDGSLKAVAAGGGAPTTILAPGSAAAAPDWSPAGAHALRR